MINDRILTKEITENADKIPLECKEQVLALMKAMAFTKKVMLKNKDKPKRTA